jgi:hypothetical protein
MKIFSATLALFAYAALGRAQLSVEVSPPRVTGQKAVVLLSMKNAFSEQVESARAAGFLLDQHGKMVGQATRWVIGGSPDKAGLAAGKTNLFNFVIPANASSGATNLSARISFTPWPRSAANSFSSHCSTWLRIGWP